MSYDPTFSEANLTLAIPFSSVVALYVAPLTLNVTAMLASAVPFSETTFAS